MRRRSPGPWPSPATGSRERARRSSGDGASAAGRPRSRRRPSRWSRPASLVARAAERARSTPIVTLNPQALDDARAVDRRIADGLAPGALCGVPVGIKDVTEVRSLRTTYGSPIYADHVPDEDACRRAPPAGGRSDHSRQDQLARSCRRRQHLQRGVRPHAQLWNTIRRAPAGSTGGGAAALSTGMIAPGRGHSIWAARCAFQRRSGGGRAATIARAGPDLADRLGLGYPAGHRTDGAHG